MKLITIAFIILLSIQLVKAQSIILEHAGYSSQNEAIFTLKNVGNEPITEIKLLLNGEQYKIINGYIEPNRTVQFYVAGRGGTTNFLTVCHGNECINTKFFRPMTIEEKQITKEKNILEEKKLLLSTIIIILIALLTIWLIRLKPKI